MQPGAHAIHGAVHAHQIWRQIWQHATRAVIAVLRGGVAMPTTKLGAVQLLVFAHPLVERGVEARVFATLAVRFELGVVAHGREDRNRNVWDVLCLDARFTYIWLHEKKAANAMLAATLASTLLSCNVRRIHGACETCTASAASGRASPAVVLECRWSASHVFAR